MPKQNQTKPQVTRLASYGIVLDGDRILLCRLSSEITAFAGSWTLPGGGVEFGEHPEEGMVREVMEETGYDVVPTGLLGVDSITRENNADSFHSVRIIYKTNLLGGKLRHETSGSTDVCDWHKVADVSELELVDLVETALAMLSKAGI